MSASVAGGPNPPAPRPAQTASEQFFRHDVRVLACGYCGAPNEVPIQGGLVNCRACRTGQQIALRREDGLSRAPEGELDRAHRHAVLRAQDGAAVEVPASVRAFMVGGGLAAGQLDPAMGAWGDALARTTQAYAQEPEERLFALTRLIAEHHRAAGQLHEARAVLETAAEVLRARRHRQGVLCMLARRAAEAGDLDAAAAWLAQCDPAPYDLYMDSDVRFTRALLATLRGDHAEVLRELGEKEGDVPIAAFADTFVAVYRAHALEHARGFDAAADALVEASKHERLAWLDVAEARRTAPITLCPRSFPLAQARVPVTERRLGVEPAGCAVLLLVVWVPMLLNVLVWREVWFDSATSTWVVPLVIGLVGVPLVARLAWGHLHIARARRARRRARP